MIISPEILLLCLQIVLLWAGVLLAAVVAQWIIDCLDRRDQARRNRPNYSTADARQIERDIERLWRGAWRDTMPPAEPYRPETRRMPAYPLRAVSRAQHANPEPEQ